MKDNGHTTHVYRRVWSDGRWVGSVAESREGVYIPVIPVRVTSDVLEFTRHDGRVCSEQWL